jgi:class 3 adenylate cyclase
MAAAFGIVAFTALRERHRGEAFASLYLDETLGRIDRRYASAVKAAAAEGLDEEQLRRRFGLGADEASFVGRAAEEIRAVETRLTPFLSPQLAARLRDEPEVAALGGEEREVSILFADLQGFTAFSEDHSPAEVLAMLNAYWAQAVPVVLGEHGGMIERFAGDAIMVVFNAAADSLTTRCAPPGPVSAFRRPPVESARTATGHASGWESTPAPRSSGTWEPRNSGASRRSATPRTSPPVSRPPQSPARSSWDRQPTRQWPRPRRRGRSASST